MDNNFKDKEGNSIWSFFDKFFGIPFWILALVFLILSIILFLL